MEDYWVYALGPIINGEYQWSVVSDPSGCYVRVFTRDVNDFLEKYEKIVHSYVVEEFPQK